MIRPVTEIEYPASEAQRARAAMLKRIEFLNQSSQTLLAVIADRVGAENRQEMAQAHQLAHEQDRLIENMRALLKS